jgi:16S rRNA (cytosine967-C5)-methyltransferase
VNAVTESKRTSARELALAVVRDVFGPERRGAQAAFDVRARKSGLDARDLSFAAELAYGSIKARRLLDWYLAPYLAGRDKPLPDAIREILRLGAYQLRCMGGVDAHAAVFETVNLALRHGHRGTAGLVNAILRKLSVEPSPPPERASFASEADYLATAFSLPTWVVTQWQRSFGPALPTILAGVNAPPQRAVRVNALRASVDAAAAALTANGARTRVSAFVPEVLIVDSGNASDDDAARWALQGEAASMPVDLLAPRAGETVLELCSGRGNKSVQIAARMADAGRLHCVEIDARKVAQLRERLTQAGAGIAAVVEGDARGVDVPQADAVLLDAPCSGLGILGRHPEARWRKSVDDPPRLAALQSELLAAAAARVAPGGRLVYSVCSTDPREGRDVVNAFLSEAGEFARAPLPERYAALAADGDVLVPPGIEGRDGFFIASLLRAPAGPALGP